MKKVWVVITVAIFMLSLVLVGCADTVSPTSEMDGYWLEADLAATESSMAELEGTVDATALRNFERCLEKIGNQSLLDAYDQYQVVYSDYMYSDTPESMWEQEWNVVIDSQIKFNEIYAIALRDHIENRK